ncbi:hypothetical protein HDK64DRAFT_314020 [Phyllosticta capitalensis]
MNLIVWPDQANKSRESVTGQYTSVLEGMTLTYPSIYLSLQSVSAYESCGSTTRAVDPATTVPTFFPFDPSDISTITWSSSAETFTSIVGTETIVSFTATWVTVTSAFDFTQVAGCSQGTYGYSFPPISVASTTSGLLVTADWSGPSSIPLDSCSPIYAIPTKITNFVPAWSTCTVDAPNGWFDPTMSWEDARNSGITGRHRDYHKNNDDFVWIYIIVYNIAGYTNFLRLNPITDVSLYLSNFRDIQLQNIYERNLFNYHQSISFDWYHFKQFKYVKKRPDIRKADQLVFFQHIVLHFQHQKLDISLDSFHFQNFFCLAKLLIYHSIFFIFKFSPHIVIVIVIPFSFCIYSGVSLFLVFYFPISNPFFFSSQFFVFNSEHLFIAGIIKHLDTNLLFCHIYKLFCVFIDPSIFSVNIFIIAVQLNALCNISSLHIRPLNSRTKQPICFCRIRIHITDHHIISRALQIHSRQ